MTLLEFMILHHNQDEILSKNQDFWIPQATTYFDIQWHKTDLNQGLCQKKLSFSITILNVTLLKLGILEWANGKGQVTWNSSDS